MSSETDPEATPGRPILLTPVPPGVWLVIGGAVVAALGPLFGFLIGTMIGSNTDDNDLDPIYLFLFLGIAVGGVGVGAVLMGVRRLLQNHRASLASEQSNETDSA